jgi:uncharacterized protein YeaO (DUF488 family)
MIVLKRAYETPVTADGTRVLVERLWPRGLTKEKAAIDFWLKDIAPSTELRKWYHAHTAMWDQFRDRYLRELRTPEASAALEQLYDLAQSKKRLTLVYASKDEEHNCAVVLKQLIEGMRKPPSGTGPAGAAAVQARARARR